ncbi:MAG: hypothetical protein MK193_10255 [Lentisphaeria bacterium]|nr:hypothetical protein [Lentisphaeria bacterium]
MKYFILALSLLFTFLPSAQARYGESYKECVKRYGAPAAKQFFKNKPEQVSAAVFNSTSKEGPILIEINFSGHDKAIMISYRYETVRPLTLDFVERVLKTYGDYPSEWKEYDWKLESMNEPDQLKKQAMQRKAKVQRNFEHQDNEILAVWFRDVHMLVLMNRALAQASLDK